MRALGVMALLLAIPYVSPRLSRWRITSSEPEDKPAAPPVAAPSVGEAALHASENTGGVTNALPEDSTPVDPEAVAKFAGSVAIEDPSGTALDGFYASLARTMAKEPGAVTRILHYGDSLIASDFISGTARRRMQAQFGDAGHGFILIANAWEWYFHNDIAHTASDGWIAQRITGPLAGDGLYGLGGVTFRGTANATASFGTPEKGDHGRNVSRFDLYYLEQPAGGDVELKVKGQPATVLSTRGSKKVSRVHALPVPDGPASLTIRALGRGDVRLFGMALERDQAGVVYDALGAHGARLKLWESMQPEHWADQLKLRAPALILLQFGTNESEAGVLAPDYEDTLAHVIRTMRAAVPEASLVVLSPLDRAEKTTGGGFKSRKIIGKLVAAQRKVALAENVAFWDTFTAMGGEGSMGRWIRATPQLGSWDLTHPTPAGAEILGDLLYKALLAGYPSYARRHPKAPRMTAP